MQRKRSILLVGPMCAVQSIPVIEECHRRSLVETKMHRLKRLGERVMAGTFERQVELHVRVALLDKFTQLGCPITVPVLAVA